MNKKKEKIITYQDDEKEKGKFCFWGEKEKYTKEKQIQKKINVPNIYNKTKKKIMRSQKKIHEK